MNEILQTTLLEYEKSTFLIDLVKHSNQKLFIQIMQTVQHENEPATQQEIKINPSVLKDLVSVLDTYYNLIAEGQPIPSIKETSALKSKCKKFLSENDKIALQNRYLKGVSISDLTIQFDCKAELIEQILQNKGIAIVDNKVPKTYFKKKFWHRRK
ncbi:MAG: hypothetical protein RIQ89_1512 [Bacteroidota bacterium]|jgi:hypothetical protein